MGADWFASTAYGCRLDKVARREARVQEATRYDPVTGKPSTKSISSTVYVLAPGKSGQLEFTNLDDMVKHLRPILVHDDRRKLCLVDSAESDEDVSRWDFSDVVLGVKSASVSYGRGRAIRPIRSDASTHSLREAVRGLLLPLVESADDIGDWLILECSY